MWISKVSPKKIDLHHPFMSTDHSLPDSLPKRDPLTPSIFVQKIYHLNKI